MSVENLKKKRIFFELYLKQESCFDFIEIFGNSNPVYLEIGCGRGEFLIQKALNLPDVNFLGIELKEKRIKTILRKLDFNLHKNVRIMKLFVDKNFKNQIPKKSISKIYIIHPDPWPKRKHHKNRLINGRFIDVLSEILKSDCRLKIVTDHAEYAKWIIKSFAGRKDFVSEYEKGYSYNPAEGHIETFFEKKKSQEGFKPIFMEFKKKRD